MEEREDLGKNVTTAGSFALGLEDIHQITIQIQSSAIGLKIIHND